MTETIFSTERLALPMARLGRPSALPRFRWQQPIPATPTPPNTGLDAEESAHGFNWGADSILPYQVSDDYDRALTPGSLEVMVLDNGRLRAVVAPTLGGRLLSLTDLEAGRELVFANPVFQPANLAALNAWFSGGIEWNGLIPGHTPFTCATVFAGVRETAEGPILRLYEFDRIVEATWQIDLFLPQGEKVLYAHGRLVNPAATDTLAYWWTNVAAPMSAGTRVLSPAAYSIEHIWPGNQLGRCDFPRADWDASYPQNWENATSVFFRAPPMERRFIASLDRTGYGLVQTATAAMSGRKFFYFGSAAGGQNWMDYLSRPGEGAYLEIQSGIAPTQNQRFVLGAGTERDWTEAFAPMALAAVAAHDPDFGRATAAAGAELAQIVPEARLAAVDAFLHAEARQGLTRIVTRGEPWGARQEQLLGRRLAAGLDFSHETADGFWDRLAAGRPTGAAGLTALPEGVAVSPAWVARLTESATAEGESWVHGLMLAVAALDREDRAAAMAHATISLEQRSSWLGHRLVALLTVDPAARQADYQRAWDAGDAPAELAVEIAADLVQSGDAAALERFVAALPEGVRAQERIVIARAVVAANAGQWDELERLLFSRQFATIREGETLLGDLWWRLRKGRLAAALGRVPTPDEIRTDARAHPLPKALDLRMHALGDD